ncbi:ABC transporter permease [Photobacterium aphoticum]|uniref:ABC transmembrane type-1 domain-containing protein n=1 Tax=Photobacterium aphoticum TaxID=754436 RepID=A0A0J1GJ04_9GAMM|nr:ABC transporter permease subunit [Photobacterium aphoticum]KLU99498.1 hypothetical protein ABT58_16710 [Photobacterium aphoticum]PSU54867.1 peptide ABC transporter permease [Photobacterium aphoticum]
MSRHIPWSAWGIVLLMMIAVLYPTSGLDLNVLARNLPPSWAHPFGTDWLGRDMLTRSLKGLYHSVTLAAIAVLLSSVLALLLALGSAANRWVHRGVRIAIDVCLSVPHLLLMILLSLAFSGVTMSMTVAAEASGSAVGIVAAIALSHWPRLTRLLLCDLQTVTHSPYFQLAQQFGHRRLPLLWRHIVPHIAPQWLTGMLIMLPQALSHMAGLTFLGFGFDPATPAIGVILSQASQYLLAGEWWLAVLPGALLVLSVLLLSASAQQISGTLRGNAPALLSRSGA